MTENEAIKGLETLKYQCKHNGECGTCNICCSAIPLAIQALEEIQQYRTIGTIEEFKSLKEKNETLKALYEDARKEGNNLLARERNKAIEELLEKQLETLENFKYWEDSSGYPIHSLSETQRISKCKELIKQIAQEMKAGGKNE